MKESGLPEKYRVQFGSESIEFQLARRRRKTLAISVHPDLCVRVVAPQEAPVERILLKVKKRVPWILRQKSYFARFLPEKPSVRFFSGESCYYLGRQYRLKIIRDAVESVSLQKGILKVFVSDPKNRSKVQSLVQQWYRSKAEDYFERRMKQCLERFGRQLSPYKDHAPQLKLRQMKARWGSCTVNGVITLNQDLIQSPSHCVEYVIAHELCHLNHRNHGPEFLSLLGRIMPDWKDRRHRLEQLSFPQRLAVM